MIGIRQLLVVTLLVVGFWLFRRYQRWAKQPAVTKKAYQEMVRCARCGIFVPKDQAISHAQGYFCNEEHARLNAVDHAQTKAHRDGIQLRGH